MVRLSTASTAALACTSPSAANTARQLARLGHLDAANDVVARVKAQWPVQDPEDRSASQFASVITLVLLGRHDEARSAALDGLDNGRRVDSGKQSAVYRNLAEALHDLGDTAALTSLYETLINTTRWWEH